MLFFQHCRFSLALGVTLFVSACGGTSQPSSSSSSDEASTVAASSMSVAASSISSAISSIDLSSIASSVSSIEASSPEASSSSSQSSSVFVSSSLASSSLNSSSVESSSSELSSSSLLPSSSSSSLSSERSSSSAPTDPLAGFKAWSDASAWPNGIPGNNTNVTIGENQKIFLDTDIVVKDLKIMGQLRCGNRDIAIRANNIHVSGDFTCGTENQPFEKQLTIELLGGRPANVATDGSGMGTKVLGVMAGGRLNLHGEQRIAWTQLDTTAEAGANRIDLADAVDWRVGDRIVIASTDFDYLQAEERVITRISNNRKTVHFNKGLQYMHYGSIDSYDSGEHLLDMRAEVGLLTRNIKIMGDDQSPDDGYGGHVMSMQGATTHISGVEFWRMGQMGLLGRYPFHWHLAGDVAGQYIKQSSIWKSYNRAVTVHGTDFALIEEVVAYDHISHGFFLEDGDENGNIFRRNLGLVTRRGERGKEVREFDKGLPATYWITNPDNIWEGNVAAGSAGMGFWFVPVQKPLRPGNWGDYTPRKLPIGRFIDNRGHSNNEFNVGIDDVVVATNNHSVKTDMEYAPVDENGRSVTTVIERFTGFKSKKKNYWSRMRGANICRNCALADARELAFMSFHGAVEDSLLVGRSKNIGTINRNNPKQVAEGRSLPGARGDESHLGAQVYNGSNDFRNVHIADFDGPDSAIGTRRSSGKHPNATVTGITFENVADADKVKFWGDALSDPSRGYVHCTGIIDLDGSLTGVPGARLTPKIQPPQKNDFTRNRVYDPLFNIDPDTMIGDLNNTWNAHASLGTDYGLLFVVMRWPSGDPEEDFTHVIRSDGQAVFNLLRRDRDSQSTVILNKDKYEYYYQLHDFPHWIQPQLIGASQGDTVTVHFVNVPSNTLVTSTAVAEQVASLAALNSATKTSYIVKDNTVSIRFVATVNQDREKIASTEYPDFGVPYGALNLYITGDTQNSGGRRDYTTLVDFDNGDDSRDRLSGQAEHSSISYANGEASWQVTNNGDGANDFVDYTLTFPRQVWDMQNKLSMKFSGADVEVLLKDAEDGNTLLGRISPQSGFVDLDLSELPSKKRDNVTGLILRVREGSLGGLNQQRSQRYSLNEIRLY